MTLTLVVLPIVILAAQEALRAVPSTIRQASYALGGDALANRVAPGLAGGDAGHHDGRHPGAVRALGEAAPLVAIGAAGFMMFMPQALNDSFTALPLQIYDWTENAADDFHHVAAAGIIVLMVDVDLLNATAVYVRYRYGKRIRW